MAGFLMTRFTKLLKLPNVTAYIVAGILIGPFCLKAVPQNVIDGSAFVSDIALAFSVAISVAMAATAGSVKARLKNRRYRAEHGVYEFGIIRVFDCAYDRIGRI